jgi:integrase
VSIYKRGNVYWARLGINGRDVRESLHTSDWQEAKKKEREIIAKALKGQIRPANGSFARLPFHLERPCTKCQIDLGDNRGPLCRKCLRRHPAEIDQGAPEFGALEIYRRDRKPNLGEKTARSEFDHSRPLAKFFGDERANRITEDRVREYIASRHGAGKANATINKELGILIGVLKRAKRWHLFSEDIERLRVRRSRVARVLEYDEKLRLLRISRANDSWWRARLAMLLALNTTMRTGEIRNLQWRDVNWLDRTVFVRRGKTEESEREIPLNREAYDAMVALRDHSRDFFGDNLAADWYVFFWWSSTGDPDPTRSLRSWRRAWRGLTRAILCPSCATVQEPGEICANEKCAANIAKILSPTAGLRFHDLRHQAITELSEGQASDETIMAIAGHVDRRMMSHYSHVRKEARRAAVENLRGEISSDTAQPTRTVPPINAEPFPQVLEKNGGDDETRTRDLCRDS